MARKPPRDKPLTATEVKQAKPGQKVRRLVDGNGLFLEIRPSGAKWWQLPLPQANYRQGHYAFTDEVSGGSLG